MSHRVAPTRTPARPRWVDTSLVAGAVAVSLVATLGARPPAGADLGPLDAWVGPDGHHEVTASGEEPTILEVTRATGGAIGSDAVPFAELYAPLVAAPHQAWVLQAERTGVQERLELARRTNEGLVVEAVVEEGVGTRYVPGAVSWPARALAGVSWTSTGTTRRDGAEAPFRRVGRLEPSPLGRGCLQAVIEETRGADTATSRETRCRGRGLVARGAATPRPEAPSTSGVPVTIQPVTIQPVTTQPVTTQPAEPPRWPGALAPTPRQVHNGLMPVTLQVPFAPAPAGPGVAIVNSLSRNVQLLLKYEGEWRILWRRHPGGTPTALAVVDGVVLVATSQRRLVAYDVSGRWLWSARTDDIANASPVGGWPGVVVSSTLDGRAVAHDLATGRELWRGKAPAGGALAPVVAAGRVVVAGESDVVALDRSGRTAWQARTPGRARALAAVAGDRVVLSTGEGRLVALDADGRVAWGAARGAPCRQVHALDDVAVCVDDERATAYDPATGTRRWEVAVPSRGSGTDGHDLLLLGADEAVRVGADGRVVGRWPDRPRVVHDVWVVPTPGGVLVADAASDLTDWGAQ
ncbi:hypothetical protein GCM10027418_21490 [Mariniluteicoccus endophyticus]